MPSTSLSSAASSFWSAPDRAGLRFLALADSDCVFLVRADPDAVLSVGAARRLSALETVATEHCIALLNDQERVEALIDVCRTRELLPHDFSTVRAIGIAPELARHIGTWQRRERLSGGLWTVEWTSRKENEAKDALERCVVKPWIERRHMMVHVRVDLGEQGTVWDCRLIKREQTSACFKNVERRPIVLDVKLADLVSPVWVRGRASIPHSTIENRFRDEHKPNQPEAPSDAVVAQRLQDATKALDAVVETLSGSSSSSGTSAKKSDAVQTAIDIREGLLKSVEFIDSARWAHWRGVTSNPAAALGKYKRQGRVFAVRSSKRDLYPRFQFAENAEPRVVMREILQRVPQDARGWSLLSWFEARNALLEGRKPSEVLESEPRAVLNAAARFYGRDD